MDIEFAEALEKILVGRGIHVYKKSLIERFEKEENGVSCHLMSEGKKQILSADAVLVSVGREPYTEELFAADLKIRMDHGKVLVNEFFMTNIPGIYAIGDVIGGVQLAHVAFAHEENSSAQEASAQGSSWLSDPCQVVCLSPCRSSQTVCI